MMTAIHLKHHSKQPIHVLIFDTENTLGCGVAYSTYTDLHLLNVAAGNMSAFPDDPEHFINWAQQNYPERFTETENSINSFLPRSLFGKYLQEIASTLTINSDPNFDFEFISQKVTAITKITSGFKICTSTDGDFTADAVVLATGNFLPAKPKGIPGDFTNSNRYFGNPWSELSVANASGIKKILIVGTGLTMVDVVQGLRIKGYEGKITALSPKGFEILPHHQQNVKIDLQGEITVPYQLDKIFKLFKKRVRELKSNGLHSDAVVDAIRPLTQKIWSSISVDERKQFLSHLRHLWGLARHRLPGQIHRQLLDQMEQGMLQIIAGRIIDINDEGTFAKVTYRERKTGQINEITVERVINCTGPAMDVTKTNNALFDSMIVSGMVFPEELKMGIKVDQDFHVLKSTGQPQMNMYALGSLLKGMLWESTAVPELRIQAKQVAKTILRDLNS